MTIRWIMILLVLLVASCSSSADKHDATVISTSEPLNSDVVGEGDQPTINPRTMLPPETAVSSTKIFSFGKDGSLLSATRPSLSADGSRVVFQSDFQIYIRDVEANKTLLISESLEGEPGNDWSFAPSISADGLTVAFLSAAENLVESEDDECAIGHRDACVSLYLYDTNSQILTRVGLSATSLPAASTALSADGSVAAIAISSSHASAGVFVYDVERNNLDTIFRSIPGQSSKTEIGPVLVDISEDGRYIAFAAPDDGIVQADQNGAPDVFLADRDGGIVWVSRDIDKPNAFYSSGFDWVPGTGGAIEGGLAISGDGRYVVFATTGRPHDTIEYLPCQHWWYVHDINGFVQLENCRNIALYDRASDTIELVSVSESDHAGNFASWEVDISFSGDRIVFTSLATNLVEYDGSSCSPPPVGGACSQVYLLDRDNGEIRLVSAEFSGAPGSASSLNPAISPDGSTIAFLTRASNILGNPAHWDVGVLVKASQLLE